MSDYWARLYEGDTTSAKDNICRYCSARRECGLMVSESRLRKAGYCADAEAKAKVTHSHS